MKVLDRETAHLCCLASDCNEPAYTRLVKGLCHQNNISLLMVPTGQELGEWCGICKIDEDGNPRKVTRQSSATTCMLVVLLTPLSLVAPCVCSFGTCLVQQVRSCSAAAITNYGRESDALTFLLNYMKKNAKAQ